MGLVANFSYGFFISRIGDISSLFATILISATIYVIMITLLRVKEFFDALKLIKRKLDGRRKNAI